MKSKFSDLIIYAERLGEDGFIEGIAVTDGETNKKGTYSKIWNKSAFQDIETTQPEQFTTKDVELRLECLKLAVSNENGQPIDMLLEDGDKIYDWITKNHNQ
jgi:hypothetical protein